jgi:hypothetical protein
MIADMRYHIWCEECDYRKESENSRAAWQAKSRHVVLTGHHVFAYTLRHRVCKIKA